MKAYKVTVLVVDHDNVGSDEIKTQLESANYGNDCISPVVMATEAVDIGEWRDDNLLNRYPTINDASRNVKQLVDTAKSLRGQSNSKDYESMCRFIKGALTQAQRDQLAQLVKGPTWDGDIMDKTARDFLDAVGLTAKVVVRGSQGFTAATYLAHEVSKADTLH